MDTDPSLVYDDDNVYARRKREEQRRDALLKAQQQQAESLARIATALERAFPEWQQSDIDGLRERVAYLESDIEQRVATLERHHARGISVIGGDSGYPDLRTPKAAPKGFPAPSADPLAALIPPLSEWPDDAVAWSATSYGYSVFYALAAHGNQFELEVIGTHSISLPDGVRWQDTLRTRERVPGPQTGA